MTNRNIKRDGQRPRYPQPQPADPNHITLGRGSVPVARNPNPEPHKTPKSIHPQKQPDAAIEFLLFLGFL